ncbi:MAG: MFS transporter [Candidatus Aenigmatarchaeota archaeon]
MSKAAFDLKKEKDEQVKRNLDASVVEGSFTAASSNMTSNYITPYALYLGATNAQIGLMNAMQSLAGTLAQLPAARLPEFISRKNVWYASHIISKLIWIPIVLLVLLPFDAVLALIALLSVYAAINSLKHPAWVSMISDIVPPNKRGEYFGKRNLISGFAGLASLLASGYILATFGFGLLFGVSVIIGLMGVYWFSKIQEPVFRKQFHYRHDMGINLNRWKVSLKSNKSLVIFTTYMILATLGIAMASPFYAVHMLKVMDIGYFWYAIVITMGALAAIVSQPYWGKISDRFGDRPILIVTGVMICFIPLLWIFAANIPMLIFIMMYDGFLFGGWSLVVFNFLISACPQAKRTSYVANHAFFVGFASVAGALLGGVMTEYFGVGVIIFGLTGLSVVFLVSFIVRLFSLSFLHNIQSNYVKPEVTPDEKFAWKVIIVEPSKFASHYIGRFYHFGWLRDKINDLITTIKQKHIMWRS